MGEGSLECCLNISGFILKVPKLRYRLPPLENDNFSKQHLKHRLRFFLFRGKIMFRSQDHEVTKLGQLIDISKDNNFQ